MLCESKQIYKNPKYRVIRYNDEYFMIDLVSTWITYFLPMINWFVPKKYAKISEKEFESLNIMDGHTEVAPLKYKQKLPCAFCSYQSVCHVDGMIDSKRYRTVDETINPIEAIQNINIDDEFGGEQ
ncbi:DUF443 family protein [Staphylococcus aureus]|uniref:DUF443 family protein n=1 Tax=Staphylococcus aureus TaxID=1280 RepID=UPI001245FE8E